MIYALSIFQLFVLVMHKGLFGIDIVWHWQLSQFCLGMAASMDGAFCIE